MDLFVEKGFIENFEIEYDPEKCSKVQAIIYNIFSEYPRIQLYIDVREDEIDSFIYNSQLLLNISNYNPSFRCIDDFYKQITTYGSSYQTIIFTEEKRDWFSKLNTSCLCFTWNNYEESINQFINKTHFKKDSSDIKFPFNWKTFEFLESNTSFLLFSDSYILSNKDGQKIKDNLAMLLKENLDEKNEYKIFLITDLNDAKDAVESKLSELNRILANYKTKIYAFNRLKEIEKLLMHDRILYTNYTLTDIGIGFNISKKPSNSLIATESIFEKFTYKRLNNHMLEIRDYISKLETWEDYNKPYKTNTKNAYKEFRDILA
jgi:transposase